MQTCTKAELLIGHADGMFFMWAGSSEVGRLFHQPLKSELLGRKTGPRRCVLMGKERTRHCLKEDPNPIAAQEQLFSL